MLTFFEGFIYAITPIIAFIIVMGSFGLQLAGEICTNHPLDSAMDASPLNYKPVYSYRRVKMRCLASVLVVSLQLHVRSFLNWRCSATLDCNRRHVGCSTPVISHVYRHQVAPTPSPAWHRGIEWF